MKEMRMALPWPSLKVPFWDAFRPGSSMPSAAPAPAPLLPPSPQLPGLGLGEEGEEAVPLGNIPADGGRWAFRGWGALLTPLPLAPSLGVRATRPQLTAADCLGVARSSRGMRGSDRRRRGA